MSDNEKAIIIALDFDQEKPVLDLVDQLDAKRCRLKVGKQLFTSQGPALVKQLVARDFQVFLDLKFHDIPNTVAKAVAAAADLGVWMVNVHAQGGSKMLQAAVKSLQSFAADKPLLTAVTILTSLDQHDLQELGLKQPDAAVMVEKLARLAYHNGLDGVVCSAQEAALVKRCCGADFLTVTPGIRPVGSDKGDQSRVVTPQQALTLGADYLVIGRPITQAAHPMQALEAIYRSLAS